ncbi:MAG TPA: hypothetical protein VKL21_10665 [Candidatus Methanoperedens sp.]|nr:hypothetical protein [Candidatus Methanoperedens sp.]
MIQESLLRNRRPRQDIPTKWKEIIKQEYEMFRLNALYQEKTIYARCKIRTPVGGII